MWRRPEGKGRQRFKHGLAEAPRLRPVGGKLVDDEFRMDAHISNLDQTQALACGLDANFDEIAPCLAENLEWSTV